MADETKTEPKAGGKPATPKRGGAGAKSGAKPGAKAAGKAGASAPKTRSAQGAPLKAAAPKLAVVASAAEAGNGAPGGDVSLVVKKKDFLERVVARSGVKKPVARDVSEAVLAVLGEALAAGESLALPPLGKLRVTRQVDKQGGEVLQIKLRRASEVGEKDPSKSARKIADDPLAETED